MRKVEIKFIDNVDHIYDDNIDVEVKIDGIAYSVTFFTLKNIESILSRYKATGEGLSGTYFWSSNMILVKSLDRDVLEKVIHDIILLDEYEKAFEKSES